MSFHAPNPRPFTLLVGALMAAAMLAVAAPHASAYTVGSDLSTADPNELVQCTDGAAQVPCTIASEQVGWSTVSLPSGYVITSWRAQLAPGTQTRLRVLRREGGSYRAVAESAAVTASGGVESFGTRIPVTGDDDTIALDVLSGAVGAVADEDSAIASFEPPLTTGQSRPGATGFDGTYRAAGPVVIVVERGVIRSVSTAMNLFCAGSKRFEQGVMGTVADFPALVGKGGTFSAKGSIGFDTYTYKGTLRPRAVSEGYLSLFRSRFEAGEGGRWTSDTCFDAKSWKAKRDR